MRNAIFLLGFILACCSSGTIKKEEISCNDTSCVGVYIGPEFINGDDIAHQFSNKICTEVGDQLKDLYLKGIYSKVDFSNISMTTEGMGTGEVSYQIEIPFIRVQSRCEAYTSFDHVGGWNHTPELEARKKQLRSALMIGDELDISSLKSTPEGLEEYWIQWRNKDVQADCEKIAME